MVRNLALLAATMLLSAPAFASAERVRFLEGASAQALTPEELAAEVTGYLPADAIASAAAVMQPPPAVETALDKADADQARQMNAHAKPERWERAKLDDASVYDRFSQQLGVVPDRRRLPAFVRLLNRVSTDAFAASTEAKKRFPRPRPFQRFQMTRVCGQAVAPKPEAAPSGGASYPSGHAVVSWAVALVMVEASPQSAQSIIARAADYGYSRVVCGLHYPSDIDAGQAVGAAVVERLLALEEFRRDLRCAKRELQSVRAGMRAEELPACQ
jgi:acid phosphatase (class A)